MPFSLQLKLTLSHLAVTIISVLILNVLIFGGYLVYLRTDAVAKWAGAEAAYLAEEVLWALADDSLTPPVAEEIIFALGFDSLVDEAGNPPPDLANDDLIVLFAPDGTVLASNNHSGFPSGARLELAQLPGFDVELLQNHLENPSPTQGITANAFAVEGDAHIGLAPLISATGEHLGWLYFKASSDLLLPFTSSQAIAGLSGSLLGAACIATIISGVIGGWLAYSFSRRLHHLSQASVALAAGDLNRRVPVEHADEIGRLAAQFNAMADQLADQMHQLHALAEQNALLAEETRALATLEERNRLARELHDAVKQQVFGLTLTAGSIRQLLTKDKALATERLAQLEGQAHDVHQEMDNIIHQLRPASLEDQGLAVALEQLVEKWQQRNEVPVKLRINNHHTLPLPVEQALYRVAQEALNNIAKHAGAKQVNVSLVYEADRVMLKVMDDGRGFNPVAPKAAQSLGLQSMAERMQEIDGQLKIKSEPDHGTTILASVPTEAARAIYG